MDEQERERAERLAAELYRLRGVDKENADMRVKLARAEAEIHELETQVKWRGSMLKRKETRIRELEAYVVDKACSVLRAEAGPPDWQPWQSIDAQDVRAALEAGAEVEDESRLLKLRSSWRLSPPGGLEYQCASGEWVGGEPQNYSASGWSFYARYPLTEQRVEPVTHGIAKSDYTAIGRDGLLARIRELEVKLARVEAQYAEDEKLYQAGKRLVRQVYQRVELTADGHQALAESERSLSEWADHVHGIAKSKGWHDDIVIYSEGRIATHRIGTWIALAHSELSEAMEELRKAETVDQLRMRIEDGKPEGFVVELADTVIRIFDTCRALGLDIAEAIEIKSRFNESRPTRHGNKKC